MWGVLCRDLVALSQGQSASRYSLFLFSFHPVGPALKVTISVLSINLANNKCPALINVALRKGNAKECSNYHTTALILHARKGILKILQVRLQQYMNHELTDVQAGFRKGRGPRNQIANIHWIIEKAREFQKNICFYFIDYAKAFDCVDHNQLWKILKETRIPDHLTCLFQKPICRSGSNS